MKEKRPKKKKWGRPELIVLIKKDGAEEVLAYCKAGQNWHGFQTTAFGCNMASGESCGSCSDFHPFTS